jgi:hypothetical protein
MAKAVRVYCMYGLGGAIWSGGIEYVLAANLRKLRGVIVPATRRYGEWREIVEEITKYPNDIRVVIGHSMGAAAATYVTDYVKVDLLVLYDLAGMAPSKLGKNTGRCIDIYDVIPDLVPEWRVQAVKGHEHKIDRWTSQHGHTGQDDSEDLMRRVVAEVKKLIPPQPMAA